MNTHSLIPFLTALSDLELPLLAERNQWLLQHGGEYRPAAVLLAIVPHQQQWHLLLTRRADTLRHHTGQIAFAGGRHDPEDAHLTATALREAHEEIGVSPTIWHTFAPMMPCYTPSGYAVSPIPAFCLHEPTLIPNPAEVAEVFYVPLNFALHLPHYQWQTFEHHGKHLPMPALSYQHYHIWGITASILYTLAELHRQQPLILT